MVKISIILATYNWPEALDVILANLVPQIVNSSETELIIADDGSTDETRQVIAKYLKILRRLQHVWHEDNGFRKSMILNKAVAASSGEYLLFLDGDCVPFPDYISQQIGLMESGYFVAGNRVLLSREFTEEIFRNKNILKNIFNWNIIQWLIAKLTNKVNKVLSGLRLGNGKWRYSRNTNWKYPKGCNFAVSQQDFVAVNGFDEEFSGWGHEDADLFVRLLHNGILIKDARFAVPVLHLWHKNADRDNEPENSGRLMERVNNCNFKLANVGISNYLDNERK